MTSFEWRPGNKYGHTAEPAYNVVSYTWGRYELRGAMLPDVRAIDIQGLMWNVPRIHPAHFSAQNFKRLIQKATTYQCRMARYLKPDCLQTEYLWLDVACIDQHDESRKMSEIGRQATIFKHAETALIWLTSHHTEQLASVLETFARAIGDVTESATTVSLTGSLTTAAGALDLLLQDPWFSSLWTLQEAFLRKDALLLSTQGECVSIGEIYAEVDLRVLTVCCVPVCLVPASDIQEMLHLDEMADIVRLRDLVQKSGLGLLHSDSPLALYTCAQFRNTMYALDRIYGIMQIFEFRLGSAAEGVEHKSFTLLELEDQLGAALLEKWPIKSQLHIHTKPATYGRSWRVSETSELPEVASEMEDDLDDQDVGHCHFSTQRIGNALWGHFKGKVCQLADLAAVWKVWSDHHPRRAWPFTSSTNPLQQIALDATDALRAAPASLHALNQLVQKDETPHELCWTLVQMFGDRIVVLSLGQRKAGKGLLLISEEVDSFVYWHRIGICYWKAYETDDAFLTDREDRRWWELQGLFG